MNNTRKITISIDIEQVLKTVYAESACLALMSGRDSRPAVISSDTADCSAFIASTPGYVLPANLRAS